MDNCLAHLRQSLIGELIVFPWSAVGLSSTISNIFSSKTAWPNKAKSLDKGNESLLAVSGSHDLDGRHAHIW